MLLLFLTAQVIYIKAHTRISWMAEKSISMVAKLLKMSSIKWMPISDRRIDLVFAGYSAGAIGLGFNSDLIKKYKNPKVIVDSFWLDSESRRVRQGWTKGPWVEINKFVYGNMPKHCKGHWSACFPQRSKFISMKIKHVFPNLEHW